MALIAGAFVAMVWPRLSFVKKMNPTIPEGLAPSKLFEENEMPDIFTSISVAILPIILIAGAEIFAMVSTAENTLSRFIGLIGSPEIALLITLFVAIIVFGPQRGAPMSKLAISMAESAKGMAMIIMVIGAGGSFKEVLVATGIALHR